MKDWVLTRFFDHPTCTYFVWDTDPARIEMAVCTCAGDNCFVNVIYSYVYEKTLEYLLPKNWIIA